MYVYVYTVCAWSTLLMFIDMSHCGIMLSNNNNNNNDNNDNNNNDDSLLIDRTIQNNWYVW